LEAAEKRSAAEVARAEAMLRKAEMRSTSAETALKQTANENKELTSICDELIARASKRKA